MCLVGVWSWLLTHLYPLFQPVVLFGDYRHAPVWSLTLGFTQQISFKQVPTSHVGYLKSTRVCEDICTSMRQGLILIISISHAYPTIPMFQLSAVS